MPNKLCLLSGQIEESSCHHTSCQSVATEGQTIYDARMEKAINPKGLPISIVSALICADRCPNCLGQLDTGWECNQCGFDSRPWIKMSDAISEATRRKL